MMRGTKFLAFVLIMVFIASAFLIPSHAASGPNVQAPTGSGFSTASAVSNIVTFSPPAQPSVPSAIFNESGLPSGTSWSVAISGHTYSTINSSIVIYLPYGTYNYSVSNSLGYFTEASTGTLNLIANGQVINTTFLGKFTVSSYLNLENGKLLGSASMLSTSQSVLPVYGVYDSYSNLFLVVGYSSSSIYMISPVNYTVMGEVAIPGSPISVAADNANGIFYVANSSALLKYSPSGTILDSVALPSSPESIAVYPTNGQVLVAGSNGGVFAYNGSDLVMSASFPSLNEFDGQGFAYNSALGQMEIVDNSGTNGFVAFLNSNDKIYSTISVPGTILALKYDAALNVSLITSISGNNPYAYVLSGSHLSKVTGSANAFGLGIDYGTGMGIVTNMQNSTVMLMNFTTASVVYTINTGGSPLMPLTLPGSSGMLIIDPNYDSLDVVPLAFKVRAVTFTEQGISPLQKWGVSVNGYTVSSSSYDAVLYEAQGNYTYSPLKVSGYANEPSGSFTVYNSSIALNVKYNKLYDVQFVESGLKAGSQWSVTFIGTSTSSPSGTPINFLAVNGTYGFNAGNVSGYAVSPANGLIIVSGSSVSVNLNFSMKSYLVNFTSAGLPASTPWYLSINGVQHLVQGSNYSYVATPGTYVYSIRPVAGYYPQVASGSVTVTSQNSSVGINWLPFLYKVNFEENMLPLGTSWGVSLSDGVILSTSASNVSAYLQNGTYFYAFYSSNTSWKGFHGDLEVNGEAITVPLNFTEVLYRTTFLETGLPVGTEWTVDINSLTKGSVFSSVSFSLPNGTSSYTAVSGNNSFATISGSLQVNGSTITEPLNFALKDANITFHEAGLPSGEEWGVHIVQGDNYTTNAGNLSVTLPIGAYSYLPLMVPGFSTTNVSGQFSFGSTTQNLTINVTYFPIPPVVHDYNVTVMEVGLPEGLDWAVSFNGTVEPSTPGGVFNFQLSNGSYNLTFMALNHKGKEMPGSLTATLKVNGTSQDLLVLFYGPYVWMVFDFPINGGGHADHHGQGDHHHKQNSQDNVEEAVRPDIKPL